jgi:hypothetical protein
VWESVGVVDFREAVVRALNLLRVRFPWYIESFVVGWHGPWTCRNLAGEKRAFYPIMQTLQLVLQRVHLEWSGAMGSVALSSH